MPWKVIAKLRGPKGDVGTWWQRNLLNEEALSGLVKDGIYTAATSAVAASIPDRPQGFSSFFEVEHVTVSSTNNVKRQTIRTKISGRSSFREMTRYSVGGTFSDWAPGNSPTLLFSGDDASLLVEPGTYEAPDFNTARSIINKPDGFVQPHVYIVRRAGATIFQEAIGWSADSTLRAERQSSGGVLGAWKYPSSGSTWSRQDSVYFWGDSAVEGGDINGSWASGESLPEQLAMHLSAPVVQRGVSGQTSNDIILRAGVVVLHAAPVGGSIPASGVVSLNVYGQQMTTRPGRVFAVTFAGIGGTLTHVSDEGWTFTRSIAGTSVAVAQPSPVVSTQSMTGAGTHIFMMSGNDWLADAGPAPDGDLVTHVVANHLRAVEAVVPSKTRHVLIAGVKTRRSTMSGDANAVFVKAVNDQLRFLYPQGFVDRQKWLATEALAAAGISPTPADIAAMAEGLVPPSAFADGDDTHIRKEIVAAEAQYLWAPALKKRGWA